MRASTLALLVLASAAPALAQERTWDVAEHTVIDADHVVLDVPATSDGAPTRARIHGTLDSALDGAELGIAIAVRAARWGRALDGALGLRGGLVLGAALLAIAAALPELPALTRWAVERMHR